MYRFTHYKCQQYTSVKKKIKFMDFVDFDVVFPRVLFEC